MSELSPPWIIFAVDGKPYEILAAMRPGVVCNVEDWPEGLAHAVVAAANKAHADMVSARLDRLEARIRAAAGLGWELLK